LIVMILDRVEAILAANLGPRLHATDPARPRTLSRGGRHAQH
jgi:hypothetical protein